MSKLETPMIRWYWNQIGGTLVEEFPVLRGSSTCGKRVVDAIVLPNGPNEVVHWRDVDIEGQDVIVIQAKAHRLGMYLMGQALFSRDLVWRFNPKSVRSVALCMKDDSVLRPMLEAFEGLEVVVVPPANEARDGIPNSEELNSGDTYS